MRLIDLDEFFLQNCIDRMDGITCEECKYHVLEVSCERLMEHPAIDAVEVVRCKDCIHGEKAIGVAEGVIDCKRLKMVTRADWFCAEGRRKDEATIQD